MDSGERLGDLGESGVLQRILPLLPTPSSALLGAGDDAAVVAAPDGRVVVSTDVLVEGRDFRREWSTAEDVGWKAAAGNLADVAAMGAVPTALVVALAAPPDLPVAWAEGLARGLSAACAGTGAGVVGGDLSAASEVVVAVTVLGDLQGCAPVRRDGARPGDVVAVAGWLGRSAAGWHLLRSGRASYVRGVVAELVEAHRRPRPPLASGPAAAHAGATAMIDLSDGLVLDLERVATASGVSVDLSRAALTPAVEALLAVGDPDQALEWVLSGGEDHGLAACFPPGTDLPEGFVPVGRVLDRGLAAVTLDASPTTGPAGFDHFSPGPTR